MAERLLKKGADGPKRLARTLAPPKKAIKIEKSSFLQSKLGVRLEARGLKKHLKWLKLP
jgi:hypothetical protein